MQNFFANPEDLKTLADMPKRMWLNVPCRKRRI